MPVATILPAFQGLEVDRFVGGQDCIQGYIESIAEASLCPLCGVASTRIQNHYPRQVADMPWGGSRVQLTLLVRKFYCDNPYCKRKIFTERLPGVVRSYGRKTVRLEQALLDIGYAEGGEVGAITAAKLGMPTSPDTILRIIRRAAVGTVIETPQVLGVDEWAYRRGHNYGAILIDLEKHQRVDLLPDRSSASFAQWLKAHPGVKTICRDRGQIYALGAKEGAPTATHVADRFHLIDNMIDAVKKFLIGHHKELRATAEEIALESLPPLPTTTNNKQPDQRVGYYISAESANRRERWLNLYEKAHELAAKGEMSKAAIARHIGLGRVTLWKYLKADSFPEKGRPGGKITAFIPYLWQRWENGCRDIRQLWIEICEQGYQGSKSRVWDTIRPWREEAFEKLPDSIKQEIRYRNLSIPTPSPSQATWWLVGLAKEKNDEEKQRHQSFVDKLCNMHPIIKKAQEIGKEFYDLIAKQQSGLFSQWLNKAQTSGISELKSLADGLEKDKEEVLAALTLPYSNGQTEGQVNRLKFIKRSMYGRANFDLLKARVLRPP